MIRQLKGNQIAEDKVIYDLVYPVTLTDLY